MPTEHTQIFTMDWGTWLAGADPYAPKVALDYMDLTETNSKPLLRFGNVPFYWHIVSATISLYQTHYGIESSWFDVYRVKLSSNNQATWTSSGVSSWNADGCQGVDDRSFSSLANRRAGAMGVGWHTLNVTDLTELAQMLRDCDPILINYTDGDNHPIGPGGSIRFAKSSPYIPYLTINYTTSLLGGVQIF